MKRKKTKLQIQSEMTREKIFIAAITAIEEMGYYYITVEDICEKAGVSKGTFYVHFRSKEDIVRLSFEQRLGDFMESAIEEYNEAYPEATPLDRLRSYLLSYCRFAEELGKEMVTLSIHLDLIAENPTLGELMKERSFLPELVDIVEKGLSEGAFRDSLTQKEVIEQIDAFVIGRYLVWSLSPDSSDIAESATTFVDCLLNGLVTAPGTSPDL